MLEKMMRKLACVCSVCLSFALLVIANTNSSYLIYQETTPEGIEEYSKMR